MTRIRVMTNPAHLLLAGNPRPSKKTRKRRKAKHRLAGAVSPEAPMTKRRKSRHRKGKMPAGLARYHAARRKAKRSARKARRAPKAKRSRRGRKSRMKKSRRSARRVARVVVMANPRKKHRRSRRRMHAKRHKSRRRTSVGSNPANLSLAGGLSGFMANAKASLGSAKGIGFAALGAGASVFAGTLMSRVTTPLVAQFAPSLATNAIGSRVIAGANYYLAAWALAKFTPGISHSTRRAMFVGGAAAAILEVIKPNMVRDTLAKLPVIGPAFGSTLAGLADDLGSYVAYALNGNGDSSRNDFMAENINAPGYNQGVGDYVRLQGADDGMGEYVQLSGCDSR